LDDRTPSRKKRVATSRFRARLEPVPHGGLYVVVPADIVVSVRLQHGARVRGTVNGVEYRSSLMKYSGVFHMGVHKATAAGAGAAHGDRVEVTIDLDDKPLPTDAVPDDLHEALAKAPRAAASWDKLAPSARREYVRSLLEARQAATRARRLATIVETLKAGVPPRRTWTPPGGR
jgi:hypothetical protein